MFPVRTLALCAALFTSASAPASEPDLVPARWTARWIHPPGVDLQDYGVYHFRRAFELPERPARFVVHVSADNRYELYVNGARVSWGPARGDFFHWRYESVDLASHLRAGRNVLAVVVWNFSDDAPMAQMTFRTGLVVQGDGPAEQGVDTGESWRVCRNPAYAPLRFPSPRHQYFVSGSGEQVDGREYPWGWEQPEFDDTSWTFALAGDPAAPRLARDAHSRWMLVPRPIPPMEETPQRLAAVRRADGVVPPDGFPAEPASLSVPARTRAQLLLDQGHLTTAFPELVVSGGRGASLELEYTEALWEPGSRRKGHRDVIAGKEVEGNRDRFVADGGRSRIYRPLFWRCYRYVQLTIETGDEPLVLEDVRGVFTAYPFERRARFTGGGPELATILEVGWRSARLCAHETYMDTPYWEQLQYVGDTRIQALVSYYVSGDGRLARNAIQQINATRTADGLTYSRAPSAHPQYIPPFSLWWIGMVHDYWRYQDDPEFVRAMLPGVRAVLTWFAEHAQPNGSLGPLPWWNYVDWVPAWSNGVPPGAAQGSSAPLDLQWLLALDWAAELEETLGLESVAARHRMRAVQLRATVRELYWDESRHLFSDTPERTHFSQHANALAVLAGLTRGAEARRLLERVANDASLAPASIYFRHYVDLAFREAGLGGGYLARLDPWRRMLADGLTTWAETDVQPRSDCHAWGASPNVEVFRTLLGIEPAAPGYRRVRVAPQPGELPVLSGVVPHPRGEIRVALERRGEVWHAEVTLPSDTDGDFVWGGEVRPLRPGVNRLEPD